MLINFIYLFIFFFADDVCVSTFLIELNNIDVMQFKGQL